MIGEKRKARLLKHMKETAKFLDVKPKPKKFLEYQYWKCPIVAFFYPCRNLYDVLRDGTIEKGSFDDIIDPKKIYSISDSHWWNSLSFKTRKLVIEWLNEQIKKGLV